MGPSGAGSRVGGLLHAQGPCGSLQRPLLWGWEFLLLPPQPPQVFSLRGLRLYFPALEPWVTGSASLPAVLPGLSVHKCGAVGCYPLLCLPRSPPLWVWPSRFICVRMQGTESASGQTACPVCPTLHQSPSHHSNASPLHPGCPSPPLLPVWMNVYFLSPWCPTSLPFDFLSVLVVLGGAVCLPTPPSWFSNISNLIPLVAKNSYVWDDWYCLFVCLILCLLFILWQYSLFLPFLTSSQPPLSLSQANPHIVVRVHGLCINVLWLIPSPSFIPPPPFHHSVNWNHNTHMYMWILTYLSHFGMQISWKFFI